VPEKMIGTLTSSILKSVHTSISPVFSYKLYSVATLGYLEPFPLENHVRIIALTPDLQRVSFYSVTEFLCHSSTTKLIPSAGGNCTPQVVRASLGATLPTKQTLQTLKTLSRGHPAHQNFLRECTRISFFYCMEDLLTTTIFT
jgi:hypothetical protein